MPEPILTREQANLSLAKVFGQGREFLTIETRHGWVAQAILSSTELAAGMGLGLGNYVLNKHTGVITAHRSLPPDLIGEEFDQAIEAGRPVPGAQVHPPLRSIHQT
ncbi:hypothetical protein ACFVVM_28845 [Nocardia sp. NPDC058176]|uniref:hypothetical protein n=1 Tax=Nocardia sp. NPDC058176 TaxID=3346368 RepID=UPI0036DBB308